MRRMPAGACKRSSCGQHGPALASPAAGTPSLIALPLLERLLRALDARFGLDPAAEISIEADPGTFDAARLRSYRGMGVSRVSVGVQVGAPGSAGARGGVRRGPRGGPATATPAAVQAAGPILPSPNTHTGWHSWLHHCPSPPCSAGLPGRAAGTVPSFCSSPVQCSARTGVHAAPPPAPAGLPGRAAGAVRARARRRRRPPRHRGGARGGRALLEPRPHVRPAAGGLRGAQVGCLGHSGHMSVCLLAPCRIWCGQEAGWRGRQASARRITTTAGGRGSGSSSRSSSRRKRFTAGVFLSPHPCS